MRQRSSSLPHALPRFRGIGLGVDPSVRATGLAVIDFSGNRPRLLASRLVKVPPRFTANEALGFIHQAVEELLQNHAITSVATEDTIYVQNQQTAQLLGAARGAALGPVASRLIPIVPLSPTAIKLAVAGNGHADKTAVQRMVRLILGLKEDLSPDESDAAAALIAAQGRCILASDQAQPLETVRTRCRPPLGAGRRRRHPPAAPAPLISS